MRKKDAVIATELEQIRSYKEQIDKLTSLNAAGESKHTQTKKRKQKDKECQTESVQVVASSHASGVQPPSLHPSLLTAQ